MSTVNIQGRDLGSAIGGAGPVDFSPINLGTGAGAGASSGTGGGSPFAMIALVVLALVAVFLVR